MVKSTAMKRSRRPRRSRAEQEASEVFGQGGSCEIVDGHICAGPVQSHHVVSKEKLKAIGRRDLLWDIRNRARTCERRHTRHTSAVERIRLELLPPAAVAFARELGLEWWLERFYA